MPKKNPRRNISRIETKSSSGKIYGGWEVRIQRRGEKTEKFFGDRRFDGKRHSLAAANLAWLVFACTNKRTQEATTNITIGIGLLSGPTPTDAEKQRRFPFTSTVTKKPITSPVKLGTPVSQKPIARLALPAICRR